MGERCCPGRARSCNFGGDRGVDGNRCGGGGNFRAAVANDIPPGIDITGVFRGGSDGGCGCGVSCGLDGSGGGAITKF